MSPAKIIAVLLQAAGIGLFPAKANEDWCVSIGSMPAAEGRPTNSGNTITVFDTYTATDGRIQATGETVIHPNVQVAVRTDDYETGYAKAVEIKKYFDTVLRTPVDENNAVVLEVQAITVRSGVMAMRDPDSRRSLFTINATMTYKEGT